MSIVKDSITEDSWLEFVNSADVLKLCNFDALWQLHPADYDEIIMRGSLIETPRYVQSYGEAYKFSGVSHDGIELNPLIKPIKEWADNIGYGNFDQVLINWYQNGHHYIGSHADSESQLKPRSPILSLSLGGTRKFRIRDKKTKKILRDIEVNNGCALVMCGAFQEELKHEIVKVNGDRGLRVPPRINITFRQFK
jgi:alkylated DNA repair dioxygenase AlkB